MTNQKQDIQSQIDILTEAIENASDDNERNRLTQQRDDLQRELDK